MAFASVWRRLFHESYPRRARRPQNRRSRVTLEVLEDRTVPAPVTPEPLTSTAGLPAGHVVEFLQSTAQVNNLQDADNLLAPTATTVRFRAFDTGIGVINYADTVVNKAPPLSGDFGNDRDIRLVPGNAFGAGPQENYVMHASGFVQIPTAGAWTFTVNSDDGFRLTMGLTNTVLAAAPEQKLPSDVSGVADVPQPGLYRYDLVYFQAGASPDSSSEVEFSARGPGQATNLLVGDPAATLRVFQAPPIGAATTRLLVSPNPAAPGQAVTLTATVAQAGGVVPAGLVRFLDFINPQAPVEVGRAMLNTSGVASIQVSTLGIGVHQLQAFFDAAGSQSDRVALQVSSNAGFVVQLYRALLGRPLLVVTVNGQSQLLPQPGLPTRTEADILNDPGVTARAQALDAGLTTRARQAFEVLTSPEYRERKLDSLYLQHLGRLPDDAGQEHWLTQLENGGTFEEVEAEILSSQEYFNQHGGSNVGFIAAAYQSSARQPIDNAFLGYLLDLLSRGFTRLVVTRSILGTVASDTRVLTDFYRIALERNPDAPGLASWLNLLQLGKPNDEVLISFFASDEFARRFG
jgi:hypothetical protein